MIYEKFRDAVSVRLRTLKTLNIRIFSCLSFSSADLVVFSYWNRSQVFLKYLNLVPVQRDLHITVVRGEKNHLFVLICSVMQCLVGVHCFVLMTAPDVIYNTICCVILKFSLRLYQQSRELYFRQVTFH